MSVMNFTRPLPRYMAASLFIRRILPNLIFSGLFSHPNVEMEWWGSTLLPKECFIHAISLNLINLIFIIFFPARCYSFVWWFVCMHKKSVCPKGEGKGRKKYDCEGIKQIVYKFTTFIVGVVLICLINVYIFFSLHSINTHTHTNNQQKDSNQFGHIVSDWKRRTHRTLQQMVVRKCPMRSNRQTGNVPQRIVAEKCGRHFLHIDWRANFGVDRLPVRVSIPQAPG